MQPFFNPYPPQFQANGPNQPQHANPNNMLQVPGGLMQPQQQMGMPNNPQIPNSSNVPSMMMQPSFANGSGQLGFANPMGGLIVGQFRNFTPQMGFANPMPNLGNYPQNMGGLSNMGLQPNGQFGLNQLLAIQTQIAMQMQQNPSHGGGFPGGQQAMGCPNPVFFGNPQFGQQRMNPNMPNMGLNGMNANAWNPLPMGNQQVQGHAVGAFPPTPNQNVLANGLPVSQRKPMNDAPQMNTPNSNWKNSPGKNFNNNNPTGQTSKWGFQKGQNQNAANANRKFGFPNGNSNQGRGKDTAIRNDFTNSTEKPMEKRRSLALNYTVKEIQQWREERRKNYPSTANIEKKQIEAQINSELVTSTANARREQLKEILAMQALLGVEVAEITSHYLSDSNTKVNGREDNRKPRDRKTKFNNKRDKRRKHDKDGRFNKKQKFEVKDTSEPSSYNKRKPTLLRELLSADVKRDKSRLLQVFRFMVMNSFFKDWPDKPLEFPSVSVNDKVVIVKTTPIEKDVAEDHLDDNEDRDDDKNDDDSDDNPDNDSTKGDGNGKDKGDGLEVGKKANFVAGKRKYHAGTEKPEEEGEIVD